MNETVKNKVNSMDNFVPSEFYLSQNYPNPFKDRTSIKYCLSERARVELTIFDSNGKRIIELFSKVQNAGTYETIFDSQDLPAGDYYYQLKAGNFNATKKMVLIR